ncbi:hypothetical protein WQ74_19310 [Escherichia coli]|nr:hypothetical protein WQ74_19310 [Escherichia coli]
MAFPDFSRQGSVFRINVLQIFTITFLRTFAARGITATAGNDCPGADRKTFCLLLGKKFCGMCISPLDWRRRLWLSLPPATGA